MSRKSRRQRARARQIERQKNLSWEDIFKVCPMCITCNTPLPKNTKVKRCLQCWKNWQDDLAQQLK